MLVDKYRCLSGTLPILNQLLVEGWHQKHEDIALSLEKSHDPSSVEALYHAALSRYRYLDYDESYGLARKCIWALSKIGTVEADRRLRDLSQIENSVIAEYARKRLSATSSNAARRDGVRVFKQFAWLKLVPTNWRYLVPPIRG